MSGFLQFAAAMREQLQATLARSDVLRSLIYPLSIFVLATIALVYAKAPFWLLVTSSVITVLFVVLYSFAFIYCLFNDRDALRSERYTLNKMAIEHGIFGDDAGGLIEGEAAKDRQLTITQTAPVKPEGGL